MNFNLLAKTEGILITAIGSFSAECVVKSLRALNLYTIIGCDIYPADWHSVSQKLNKVYQVPRVTEKDNYLESILKICLEHQIKYIIPLTDLEVDFFNAEKQKFKDQGITVCIPLPESLKIARNKYLLFEYFSDDINVPSIETYKANEVSNSEALKNYPYIAKPFDGRSSEGIAVINNYEDLTPFLRKANYIIQRVLDGPIFTVDYIRGTKLDSDFSVARKELLRTKNGAGVSVEIVNDQSLNSLASYIGNKLNIIGCINMEFILFEGKYHLIDINPRFSAGVAFTSLAGYDMVVSHLNCFIGGDIMPKIFLKRMTMVKKMVEIITSK